MTFDEALAKYPTLCATGFGISNFKPQPTHAEALRRLEADREELRTLRRTEIAIASAYLWRCQPTVTARQHSYYLKHRAEAWAIVDGERSYVSNGALITAALLADLVVRPCEPRALRLRDLGSCDPNAWVGVSKRSVDMLITRSHSRHTPVSSESRGIH